MGKSSCRLISARISVQPTLVEVSLVGVFARPFVCQSFAHPLLAMSALVEYDRLHGQANRLGIILPGVSWHSTSFLFSWRIAPTVFTVTAAIRLIPHASPRIFPMCYCIVA